jgi:cell division protein FtsZ
MMKKKFQNEKFNPRRKKDIQPRLKRLESQKPFSGELFSGVKKIRVKVIGLGDGGANIVSEIGLKIKGPSFLVANTDSQSLKKTPKNIARFQFGQNITGGLGTGMKPELGEMAAREAGEKIKKILKDIDLCIFVASLGGGTASGATPVFIEISRNLRNVNYGIFTLPFEFEGKRKLKIARDSLEKMRPNLNSFSIIENERIFQIIDRGSSLKTALSELNKILARSLQGLIEIIYQPGLINIDFADIKTILKGSGKLAFLNTVEASGEQRQKEVVEKVLNSPLHSYNIAQANAILFNITGDKNLTLSEVGETSKAISQWAEKGSKIIFGISEKKEYRDKIKITLLATGCQSSLLGTFSNELKISPKVFPAEKKSKEKKPSKKGIKIKVEDEKTKAEISSQIRKNALQLKRETEQVEKEMLEKEKFWEIPAIFRQKGQNAESD